MRLEGGSGQASRVLGGEGPLRIEPRPGATGGCTLAGLRRSGRAPRGDPGLGSGQVVRQVGWGSPWMDGAWTWLAGAGPRLHGAILCFRIRIVNFILNCRTAAGGEDGAVSGHQGVLRREGVARSPSPPSPLTQAPVTFRHIRGFDEGRGL